MPPAPPAPSTVQAKVCDLLHIHGNWSGVRPALVIQLDLDLMPVVVATFNPSTDGLALIHLSGNTRMFTGLPLYDNLDDYPEPTGPTGMRAIISSANPGGWLEYRASTCCDT